MCPCSIISTGVGAEATLAGIPWNPIEPMEQFCERRGLLVARSLASSSSTVACILNPSLAPIKMHANERIGQFQPMGSQVLLPATAQVSAVVPTHQNTAVRQMEQGIQGLTETEKSKLHHLLEEYADIISASEEDMGRTNVVRHTINTGDADPVRQPPRRLPFHQRSMVKQMLDDMLSKGVIEPSAGPWSSPIVLVPKKDGSIRFCVDFRRLNSLTKKGCAFRQIEAIPWTPDGGGRRGYILKLTGRLTVVKYSHNKWS